MGVNKEGGTLGVIFGQNPTAVEVAVVGLYACHIVTYFYLQNSCFEGFTFLVVGQADLGRNSVAGECEGAEVAHRCTEGAVAIGGLVGYNALAVDALDLSNASLKITGDISLLDVRVTSYTLATSENITGLPTLVDTDLPHRWSLQVKKGALMLVQNMGFKVMLH